MYRRLLFILTILTLAVGGTRSALRAQVGESVVEVPFSVTEPSALARSNAPITSGLPIPSTAIGASWALFDGATEIPVQTTVLPGVKTPWLLLDFQTSLTANQQKSFTLREQVSTVSPSTPVTIDENSSRILVTTGPLKAEIDKTDYNLFDGIWLDQNSDQVFSDPSERVVAANADSNITVVDAVTGNTYTGRANVDEMTWEDSGSLRATLKISGRYMNGGTELLKYTTRLSFFAGRRDVRIEHIIRNSLASNERAVKITSAPLIIGGNSSTVTATGINSRLWTNVLVGGSTIQLVPSEFTVVSAVDGGGFRSATQVISTATNGGFIIGDLSHHGTTATLDFSSSLSPTEITNGPTLARAPLIAVASADWYSQRGAFGAPNAGTYQDEQTTYTKWGWTWGTTGYNQIYENRISHMPSYAVDHSTVQGSPADPEDDSLWEDIFLFARTGLRGYYDRALGWANYSKWQYAYRTDGFAYDWGNNSRTCGCLGSGPNTRPLVTLPANSRTTADDQYLANNVYRGKMSNGHFWTGGLVDWYYLTGDREALAASVDHAEVVDAFWGGQTPGIYDVGENIRGPSRNLMVALRVWEATSSAEWKAVVEHMMDLFLTNSTRPTGWAWWDETNGMYYTHAYDFNSNGQRDTGDGKFQTVWMAGIVSEAFYRYYDLTSADTTPTIVNRRALVAHRLVKMATFFRDHLPNPANGYTEEFVHWDYPTAGTFNYPTRVQTYAILGLPPVTYVFTPLGGYGTIDALAIGFRLTGDSSYLAKAKSQWDKASKRPYNRNDLADDTQLIAGPNTVGHFSGAFGPNYNLNPIDKTQATLTLRPYDIVYNHFFFYDAARLDEDPPSSTVDLQAL